MSAEKSHLLKFACLWSVFIIFLALGGQTLAGTTTVVGGPANFARETSAGASTFSLPDKSVIRTIDSIRNSQQDFFLTVTLGNGAQFVTGGLPNAGNMAITGGGGAATFSIVTGGGNGSSQVSFLVDISSDFTALPECTLTTSGWKIADPSNRISSGDTIGVTITTRDASTGFDFDSGMDTDILVQGAYGVAVPQVTTTTATISIIGGQTGFVANIPDTERADNGASIALSYVKDIRNPDGSAYALVATDSIELKISGNLAGVITIVVNSDQLGGTSRIIHSLTPEEVTAGLATAVFTDTDLSVLGIGGLGIRIIVDGTTKLVSRALQISAHVTLSGGSSGAASFSRDFLPATTLTTWTYSANLFPSITSISPSTASMGGAAFTLTVNGHNFASNSSVRWNDSSRTTTFVSDSQLTAAIPTSDIAAAGTAQVTVNTPPPGGGNSNALTFTTSSVAPTLASISPTSATAGGTQFTLTANGGNFLSGAAVRWNGSNRATTFVSATQLTAVILASDIAAAGTVQVTVINPAPGSDISNAVNLTINNPVPTLTALSPANAGAGGIAFTLTVTGSSFVSSSKVRWNAADRTTTFVSSTQLTAAIPAADIAAVGSANVTVSNSTPGGGTSAASVFTIFAPQPSFVITMSKNTYVPGDTITATEFRLKNLATSSVPVEIKVWLEFPGQAPIGIVNFGSDGSLSLPPSFDTNLGPLSLFTVGSASVAGSYAFSSRILDPVTGETLNEDLNPFTVQTSPQTELTTADGESISEINTASVADIYTNPATGWGNSGLRMAFSTFSTSFIPTANITMSSTVYGSGNAATAQELRLSNSGVGSGKIEVKIWQTFPTGNPTSFVSVGSDGSLIFPGNFDVNVGPLNLFVVGSSTQKGSYSFNIRLVDPDTGAQYSFDLNPFTVQ